MASKKSKDASSSVEVDADHLTPRKPEGYEPAAELEVVSQSETARVVTDGVLVWKEAL